MNKDIYGLLNSLNKGEDTLSSGNVFLYKEVVYNMVEGVREVIGKLVNTKINGYGIIKDGNIIYIG